MQTVYCHVVVCPANIPNNTLGAKTINFHLGQITHKARSATHRVSHIYWLPRWPILLSSAIDVRPPTLFPYAPPLSIYGACRWVGQSWGRRKLRIRRWAISAQIVSFCGFILLMTTTDEDAATTKEDSDGMDPVPWFSIKTDNYEMLACLPHARTKFVNGLLFHAA